MEQRNNKFKGKSKETKKEYNRRWQLREKIRRKEETKWKQLQYTLRSFSIKELRKNSLIDYMEE